MTKNYLVEDYQPNNQLVLDYKPITKADVIFPNNSGIDFNFGSEQLFTVILGAGSPYGLLLTLTQPTAGTVQSPITS